MSSAPQEISVTETVLKNDVISTNDISPPVNTSAKKRVIIGLPGREFSSTFMISLIRALYILWESNKYEVILCPAFSSFVAFSRMKTLGLDVLRGEDQKPFNGMDYDVYLTIDSDIIFTPEQLIELIENTSIHPVVSGLYRMSDLKHVACVKDWDKDFFIQNGTFQFLSVEDVRNWKEETKQKFMEVSYNGMGFFACKKEVLDALKYPYFWTDLQIIPCPDGKVLRDMCSEDVAFCKNIQKAGYTVYVNTDIVVGHEKPLVI